MRYTNSMLDPRFVTKDLYLVSFGGGSKHMRSAVKRLKKEGLDSGCVTRPISTFMLEILAYFLVEFAPENELVD